ncbi:hypothetical protein [Rhodovulum sp. 12E13]|uniref:hypothetical protein n=1 Tax=Rhodovulum sp. 12E13 TaxID=2203891 RepID=UPI0013144652|nr:hypothetical protein [Rhodovulum sp. 12E13]
MPTVNTIPSRSGKIAEWVLDRQRAFDHEPVMQVFDQEVGTPVREGRADEHRVLDAEPLPRANRTAYVVDFRREADGLAQVADVAEKLPGLVPVQAGFAPAVDQNFVEDLHADGSTARKYRDGTIPFRPIVVEQIEEMGWMPLSPDGIAMCQACGVESQAEGEGIHGRS